MDVTSKQPERTSVRCGPVHREAFGVAVGINGVSGCLCTSLVDSCARSFKRIDEWAYVPNVDLASLGPARNIVWPRRWGQWLPGWKRLCAHTIYAARVWYRAILEDGVLIQVVTIIIIVIIVIALWQCEPCEVKQKQMNAPPSFCVLYS